MTTGELHRVVLEDLPLDVMREAGAHHEEVFRELHLIRSSTPEQQRSVSQRLLQLLAELDERYREFTAGPSAELEEAMAKGSDRITLVFDLPAAVVDDTRRFREILHEVDACCSSGELVAVAPPSRARAFRNWYLDEFINQIERGAAPTRFEGEPADA